MSKIEFSGIKDLAKRSLTALRHEGPDRLFLYGTRYLSWKVQFHRFARSLPNPIATAVYHLTSRMILCAVRLLNRIYPHKYTDADPYKRLLVDPSAIEYTTGEIFSKRRGWVVNGEWDKEGKPYMQRTFAKAIEQRYLKGLDWEETALVGRYNESKFERRAATIDRLYQHIYKKGYKSQRQLLEEDPQAAWDGVNDAMHPLANEIAVDIGRNGELLWNMCGQHRLAIAKVLEIDEVYVQVFRRHKNWQAIRERARRGKEIPEQFHNHPDLQDLLG